MRERIKNNEAGNKNPRRGGGVRAIFQFVDQTQFNSLYPPLTLRGQLLWYSALRPPRLLFLSESYSAGMQNTRGVPEQASQGPGRVPQGQGQGGLLGGRGGRWIKQKKTKRKEEGKKRKRSRGHVESFA